MRKVKLIVHETYQGKRKSEDVFAAVFLSNAAALTPNTHSGIIKDTERSQDSLNGALSYSEVYIYDGNGNTGRCKVIDGAGNVLDDYRYEYDSLGRLIRSSQVSDGETVLRTEHLYDTDNRLTGQSYQIGQSSFSESYEYNNNDGSMKSMTTASGDALGFGYDALKRLQTVTGPEYTKTYGYRTISGNQTTTQISSLRYSGFSGAPTYHYAYTANGNISSQWENSNVGASYQYDSQGQLISASDSDADLTYTYTYDNAGNLLTAAAKGGYHDTEDYVNRYTYGNNGWPDLLTAFNGKGIAYEGQTYNSATNTVSGTVKSGNPVSYFNGTRWSFGWENGRQLTTATTSPDENTELSVAYTYDLNGLRTSKTVTTKTYAIVKHTVTFVADGVTVKTMTVDDGYVLKDSDYPVVPAKKGQYGYWNQYTDPVTEDLTISAGYRFINLYTVTFVALNSTVKTMTVSEGYVLKDSDYPEVPSKTGYTGMWQKYTSPITANITIQATYSPEIPVPTLPPDISIMSQEDEEVSTASTNSPAMEVVSTVTERHDYIYAGGKLLRETITTTAADGTVTTNVLDFAYDAQGTPYSLTCTNGTATPETYYYITNLQGDVMYLLNASGTKVAEYDYDPYGKLTYSSGSLAGVNPLRYRGYYYDSDTEFYYLQSRYYDANICRFINADSYSSTGQGITGYNMFAYCGNNPVLRKDNDGDFWHLIVGAVVGIATQYVSDVVTSLAEGKPLGEALKPTSSWADYGSAAISGALSASGIGHVGSVVANAALSGATYLANCAISGEEVNSLDFLMTTTIGGISGFIGGSGADGKKLRGVYGTAKDVLKTAVSPKKQLMYMAKKTAVKKAVAMGVARTVTAGLTANAANYARKKITHSLA